MTTETWFKANVTADADEGGFHPPIQSRFLFGHQIHRLGIGPIPHWLVCTVGERSAVTQGAAKHLAPRVL